MSVLAVVLVCFGLFRQTNLKCSPNDHYTIAFDREKSHYVRFGAVSLLEETVTASNSLQATGAVKVPRGSKLKMTCQCIDTVKVPLNMKLPMEIPYGVCAATDFKITEEETGSGMTEDDVRTVMGNPLLLRWVNVNDHHFSDWEPRTDAPVLGTPGGDFIEFINMLDTFEDLAKVKLQWWHCRGIMYTFLAKTKKMSFYYATDTKALRQLQAMVDIDNLDLRVKPSDGERWRILNALLHPDTNGCSTLRGILQDPGQYDLRPGLAQCAIIGFFDVIWNKYRLEGKKLRIVLLDNMKQPKGVLKIRTSEACQERRLVPLLEVRKANFEMFVAHVDAVNSFRAELSKFMADLSDRVDPTKFLEHMKANGAKYLSLATASAGAGLPVYEVDIV
eukprot:c4424_g1_i1.p1 GENE.c4424_g1_i1~~c4424_g1_i1.p1  ORF type:complete len:390 (-),score=110.11 c4424_g1_i1:58-1227(-)